VTHNDRIIGPYEGTQTTISDCDALVDMLSKMIDENQSPFVQSMLDDLRDGVIATKNDLQKLHGEKKRA
jgi:hypothetical protein